MPTYIFPSVESADENGVIAIGGDTHPDRLLAAYKRGIFPWPYGDLPLLWFCPDPRFVLVPRQLHMPRSLLKSMRNTRLTVRVDSAFAQVIDECSNVMRPGQSGTWITEEIKAGYQALHERGYAHSIEAYLDEVLVGGLYGVSLGKVFFGESMFSKNANASKIAFATLVAQLIDWNYMLIDCQAYTDHLARFGASEMARADFLELIKQNNLHATCPGRWTFNFQPSSASAYLTQIAL